MDPFSYYDPRNEGNELSAWLDLHVQNFESGYRIFWGLDVAACPEWLVEELWLKAKKVDVCFSSILSAAYSLALNLEFEALAEDLEPSADTLSSALGVTASELVFDRLEITLAYEALQKWIGSRGRFQFLVFLIGRTRIGERGSLYLERATKLYVWGFDVECIVMCASVLEAVLENELAEVDLRRYGLAMRPKQTEWEFWQLIEGARQHGLIDAKEAASATRLRKQRNELLHELPLSDEKAAGALLNLAVLLASIYPDRGSNWSDRG